MVDICRFCYCLMVIQGLLFYKSFDYPRLAILFFFLFVWSKTAKATTATKTVITIHHTLSSLSFVHSRHSSWKNCWHWRHRFVLFLEMSTWQWSLEIKRKTVWLTWLIKISCSNYLSNFFLAKDVKENKVLSGVTVNRSANLIGEQTKNWTRGSTPTLIRCVDKLINQFGKDRDTNRIHVEQTRYYSMGIWSRKCKLSFFFRITDLSFRLWWQRELWSRLTLDQVIVFLTSCSRISLSITFNW